MDVRRATDKPTQIIVERALAATLVARSLGGKQEWKNDRTSSPDTELLARLNKAVAVANDAQSKVTTAQDELVSRSKAVGQLLLEAKKLHPAPKDFESFLKKVNVALNQLN